MREENVSSDAAYEKVKKNQNASQKIIFSIGNDGKVMKCHENGELLNVIDLKEFLYNIESFDNHLIVCGENNTAYKLDYNLKIIEKIENIPQTCWSLKSYKDLVYICDSNGAINIFHEDYKHEHEVAMQISPSMKSQKIVPKDPNYKIENGKVYQLVNGEHVLIGVVDEEQKSYDYTIPVEVDNKTLQLSFNKNDNIYTVANNFIKFHNLHQEYVDDIVTFITKNFPQKKQFKIYDKINVENIRKFTDNPILINNLKSPDIKNNKQVEDVLKSLLVSEKQKFYVLDCYRFFVSRGFVFDFCWLQFVDLFDTKMATIFVRLVTNLFQCPPFNLEILDKKVSKVIDCKLCDENTISNYKLNKNMSK
ncbi:hypothetical protein EDEG_01092 [Edhazardia aedis USNM 41457]|uniref:PFU domain-containing protein n=1 Tax=Edhazardia aedis (strain USNM 41457) TaxID=1003232 RepID=J9DAE2_EDHAE|nr:hypothetical protein EDEG_01092 [Edhazardia aedis USNM 41457]|eukprot:EJW04706.1 hypothetical protein EDEG_01092 [Edhazardia aedis USNM 41457]